MRSSDPWQQLCCTNLVYEWLEDVLALAHGNDACSAHVVDAVMDVVLQCQGGCKGLRMLLVPPAAAPAVPNQAAHLLPVQQSPCLPAHRDDENAKFACRANALPW
jgi:hypothetical protein